MRSELINEIFSIETKAEKIAHEAQIKGRGLVSQAQKEGEEALQKATEKVHAQRDVTITKAQDASEARIAKAEKALQETEAQKIDLASCADLIAKKLVTHLSSTKLGELSE